MPHTDESFAAMLLTLPLSPEGEEAVKPLNGRELGNLCGKLSLSGAPLSSLRGRDVSYLMSSLGLGEDEAYRLCILLSRDMLVFKLLEDCLDRNVSILTPFDNEYPASVRGHMGGIQAPPMFVKGNPKLFDVNYVGILGIEGVKTPESVLAGVRDLVEQAADCGLGIATEDSLGACRAARMAAMDKDGALLARMICAVDGNLFGAMEKYERYTDNGTALVVSLAHPEAPASTRNVEKLLCALSCAAFIATTDGKQDEAEIVRHALCDYLYVFDAPELPGNAYAAAKGFEKITRADVSGNFDKWTGKRGEQLSFL